MHLKFNNIFVMVCILAVSGLSALFYWYAQPTQEVARLLKKRAVLDETVWAQEVAAQEHEQTIVKYWDRMLFPKDDKYAVLAEIPFRSITIDALGQPDPEIDLERGVSKVTFGGPGKRLDKSGWEKLLAESKERGYVIDAIEFHQSSFEIESSGAATSIFSILLNVVNSEGAHRWSIKSNLRIQWTDRTDADGYHIPGDLTLFQTEVLKRKGPLAFEERVLEPANLKVAIPIVHDVNGDGYSDIILPTNNILLLNEGDGKFEKRRPLFKSFIQPLTGSSTSVVADFNGDGKVDLLFAGTYTFKKNPAKTISEMGLYLFPGDDTGEFNADGRSAVDKPLLLRTPQCMAVGDIDDDGDLDVWLAQYKNPFKEGSMPTPFYDSNDGYPSYLLLNNGDGTFKDATESAGLTAKRYRRTFAASFVDIDNDHDLDLIVSSDFSGSDVYLNDGAGRFTDTTDTSLDESANFAMAHTFADFNRDGNLDFYVTGMASTTMRRLNQMGIFRQDQPEMLEMRTRMGYGNRMYMGQGGSSFLQPSFKDNVARSGWSWGAASLDFDNDGDMDIYVANGHKSGPTTKDYCTNYWCHDIYTGTSDANPILEQLFDTTYTRHDQGLSWDGYQKNHLFMNQSGSDFVNVGFLMNVALIEDSRTVITDDFDLDGRPDLLVTSYSLNGLASKVHILMNRWSSPGNWIGIRLRGEPGGPSPIGAVIRIVSESGERMAHIVTGDSYRAQHAFMKHFGLGTDKNVNEIRILWPDQTESVIKSPDINRYYQITPSTGA